MRASSVILILTLGCGGPATPAPAPGPVTPAPAPLTPVEPEPAPLTAPPVVSAQVVTAPPKAGDPPPRQPSQVELEQEEKRRRYGAVWPPPGYVEPPCELELSTKAVRRGRVSEITAFARNKSAKPIRLELPSRCPQGPVVFSGLSPEYDYYRSCAKGACGGPRDPVVFEIKPGEQIELEMVEIDPQGANCTAPLPPGTHSITFAVPFAGKSCFGATATVRR